MAPPSVLTERQLKHRRRIDVQIYSRSDGLWEVEAHLDDVKPHDVTLAHGLHPGGQPVHDLGLRVVVDTRCNIVEAGARTDAMPYPGHCDDYGDAYTRLVGLNLLDGFRAAVKGKLGGVLGCTHLTELTAVLPTAVVQAFAGEGVFFDRFGPDGEPLQPFQIDRCHALRADAPAVRVHYPRWYRAQASPSATPRTSETP